MNAEPSTHDVGDRLLAHLRRMPGMHSVGFAEPPSPIAGGFETRIFGVRLAGAPAPFEGPLVLRLFREADAAPRVRFEAAVHGAVAAQGYPAPRVIDWNEDVRILGGPFLVLERLPGANLLPRLADPALFRFPVLLADAQRRLHALDPVPVLRAAQAWGFSREDLSPAAELAAIATRIAELGLAGLEPGVAWLHAQLPTNAARTVLCHGDFHPRNVLAQDGRVTGVVDWTLRHVKLAEPAYDVGATLALLSHAPADVPRILRSAAGRLRRRLVRAYLERYCEQGPLPAAALRVYEALRLLDCLLEAAVHRLADRGAVARPAKPTAFGSPTVQVGMLDRFRELTGVTLLLPPGA